MKLSHLALSIAALAALPLGASAQSFTALSGTGFTTETGSVANQYLTPIAPAGTVASYSVLSTASGFSSVGTMTFGAPVTSFTFLWGSPDSFNSVTDGLVTVTGSMISSGLGNNAESKLYTFFDAAGFSALTFRTTGIAFELAVAPVPEPESYALMLAGLGAMLFISRRRRA